MHKSNVEFKIIPITNEQKAIAKALLQILDPIWPNRWQLLCDEPNIWDDLLWTVTPISFLPHGQTKDDPVIISSLKPKEGANINVINLQEEPVASGNNVIEIVIDQDDKQKQLSRLKYKHYKQQNFNILTSKL